MNMNVNVNPQDLHTEVPSKSGSKAQGRKHDAEGGALIKRWRERRHLSQKELATAAGVSCRHVSFVETGRSKASRKMVLRLCEVLDVPYRARNQVLEASGYEPAFSETGLEDQAFARVSSVVTNILGRNEPFPSVALDGHWNVLCGNDSARKLFAFLLGGQPRGVQKERNLVRWLIDGPDLRDAIVNWNDVAVELIRKLHKKIEIEGADKQAQELLEGLIETIDPDRGNADLADALTSAHAVPVVINKSGMTMSFLISSLEMEAPKDITLQEMRIATLHPLCKDTEEALRFLAISRL